MSKISHFLKLNLALCFALMACSTTPLVQPVDGLDVVDNQIKITPDFSTKTLTGQQFTQIVRRDSRVKEIVFSINTMLVSQATINGAKAEVSTRGELTIFQIPSSLRNARKLNLAISFSGTPRRGVTFAENLVYTNYFACDWMFCDQNKPSDKSTLAVTLNLPNGMSSLAPGLRYAGGPAQTHRWRSSNPVSPYLFGFAAGLFTPTMVRHKDIDLAYINATGVAQPLTRLFGTTPAMIEFFTQKAGFELPAKRYTQILVTGSEAQEHATYSTIGTHNILPILANPEDDWVIAHELAHQWWGNSITCASWHDFWLNEGMTVFMVAAWKEHRHGHAAYDREMSIAQTRWTRAKEAGWDRPLAFAGTYPTLGTRRAIQYSKGALFLDHLRTQLGEVVFWNGIKDYSRTNAGKTVTSNDFQNAMERASRRDLQPIFDEWVYGANGAP